MVEISKTRLDMLYIAKKPIHNIDKMRELGEQRTTIQTSITMPASRFIITFIPIPEAIELYEIDFSQPPRINHLLDPDRWWRIAVLHHTKDFFLVFQRSLQNPFGILHL